MKRILLIMLMITIAGFSFGQATYYWVGGAGPVAFTANSNWNTTLDGTGATRVTADPSDILIFSGANIGGTVPVTGTVTATITSVTIGQLKLTNSASVVFTRTGGSTGTLTISGSGAGDDLVVEAGSSLSINSTLANGNVQMVFGSGVTGRVNGSLSLSNTGQQRISNGTTGTAGSFVFASGSSFTANITSASASYPFGSNSQSSEKWVVFEAGADLYYEGGWSPMGNNSAFSAIDFKPGSNWHHRATNAIPSAFGSFFNTKSFGNIIVENNATLGSDGPIYRIGNLTINTGCGFTTHSSGQTVLLGNMVVDGSLTAPALSTNVLVMGGNVTQTVSGGGTINVPNFTVADNSDIVLNKNISVITATNIYGKINFNSYQVSGAGTFTARVSNTATNVAGNLVANSYQITGVVGTLANLNGLSIIGTGIAPNTNVVGFSSGGATINLSQPITTTGSAIPLIFSNDTAILITSHPGGLDSLNGSVIVTGTKNFQSGTNYIINGATTWPFGISSGSTNTYINAGFVEVNAPVTVNRGITVYSHILLNQKMMLRPSDTLHVVNGATINGTFNSTNYIVTDYNNITGVQSIVQYDGAVSAFTLPIGTVNYYMPVTITPTSNSDFSVAVFEGITTNGTITGTALTTAQKQTVVNSVWNINRLNGSGDVIVQLSWNAALEGSTFATLPNTDIGLIKNNGSSWDLPVGTGNNTTNNVTATLASLGSFSAGAVPQVNPFVFNALPVKTYGDADFNGGATSLNTTQPIVYSSSNPAVATIINGNIHITGAGTANITALQATDGFYAAASATQLLTVNKTALTIAADNKLKFEGQVNPTLTATYTRFVLGETPSVLLTPAIITTTAVTASPPGTYPITVNGATSNNYNITFVNGLLTVQAKQAQTITFNALPTKTYGNADFPTGATSTNNTIPITYVSSNTAVATVNSSGIIHITGGGTTTITASQAGNAGYFPAADVARALTVSKVNLTIRVRDTTKVQGQPNPPFTITYTGFVLGETASNLTTQPQVNTIATTNSTAGYYSLTPEGAVSNNYNLIYVPGRLTIYPTSGTDQQYLHAFMPSKDILTVRVYSVTPAIGDIVLWDMSGRPVLKKNLYMPPGFISADLFISTLPTGIYTVTVRGEGVDLKKTIAIMK